MADRNDYSEMMIEIMLHHNRNNQESMVIPGGAPPKLKDQNTFGSPKLAPHMISPKRLEADGISDQYRPYN